MFTFLKKTAARTSAAQIGRSTIDLIDAIMPFEEAAVNVTAGEPDDRASEQVRQLLVATTQDANVASAVRSLQFALLGPIPIDLVREDIFKPFLSGRVPPHVSGALVSKAFRDVIQAAKSGRTNELAGIESIWFEIKSELLAGRPVAVELEDCIDPRFRDL